MCNVEGGSVSGNIVYLANIIGLVKGREVMVVRGSEVWYNSEFEL